MILNGLAMMGLALFGLGSIQTLWLAVAIAGLLGAVAITIQVPLVSHLQRAVPQKLQGRVFATMTAVVALATPLGAAVFGQALEKIAVSKVFLLGAGGCLTVAFIWWIFGIVRGVGLAEHGNEETSDPESLEEGSETAGDAAAPVAREADSRS